jgi:hypothetical protein
MGKAKRAHHQQGIDVPCFTTHPYTQISILPSFRHGLPESRGQEGIPTTTSLYSGFRHSLAERRDVYNGMPSSPL